jgi:hypothetical protein
LRKGDSHLAKKPLEDKALGYEEGGDGQHENEEAVEEDRLEDSSVSLLSSHHLGPDMYLIIKESSTEEKY